MVCDPNPGARERAIEALIRLDPNLAPKAGLIVDMVSEALVAGTLQAQIKH